MNQQYQQLVKKLKEILQMDQSELDFGLYRILRSRADEIKQYLEHDLKAKVERSLLDAKSNDNSSRISELETKIKDEFGKRAFNDEGNLTDENALADSLGKEYQSLKANQIEISSNQYSNEVFAHLTTFFSRYYDKGDFLSKRRYKGDTYAIPYDGEEVILHWANKDQYYIKSGEQFTDFTFSMKDERRVHFKLVSAETSKDNRKDSDKERRFVLVNDAVITKFDEEGEEYEEVIPTFKETETDLYIHFEYKSMSKGTKQSDLNEDAVKAILESELVQKSWHELKENYPTEKNPGRSLIEKQLHVYTAKNSSDYFIHKNLKGFLSRELDFYIKNEVMNLDDIQNIETFKSIEHRLRMIQVLREIASDLIEFLAQLENFQKKLWLKKKFVVDANYCITLDRLEDHPELTQEIVNNKEQQVEWQKLFGLSDNQVDTLTKLTVGEIMFASEYKYLVADTQFFSMEFKYKLLETIENVDESTGGLLINSENFQALNLLQERYKEQVKCVYIDPPYNTNSTPIIYKNEYKHSSWASLIQDRIRTSMNLLRDDGIKVVAIDDAEMVNLSKILDENSPGYKQSKVSVVHNPKGSITNAFNRTHEYALFLTPEGKRAINRTLEENEKPRKMRRWGENSLRVERKLSFYPVYIKDGEVVDIGSIPLDEFHPSSKNITRADGLIEVWPIDQNGVERRWNFGLDSIRNNLSRIKPIKVGNEYDLFLTHEETVPKTVWTGGDYDAGKYGNSLLIDILGVKRFDFPKSINLVKRCLKISTSKKSQIMDYFGGSGTTGHAVINLNREDQGSRKYILVEMGEYFDTVTKPRIQKVIYSKDWKAGKPTAPESGVSQCFKYFKMESYEDTLNNLDLVRSQDQQDLLNQMPHEAKEEYLLKYMLDLESQNFLSTEMFNKPFDYTLQISKDSSGASTETKIDLVETFNYLIGLKPQSYTPRFEKGYLLVEGENLAEEKILIIWRDCEKVSYEDLLGIVRQLDINPNDFEYDRIYVNGDHTIPNQATKEEVEGEVNLSLSLRQIEDEFMIRMFDVEDV